MSIVVALLFVFPILLPMSTFAAEIDQSTYTTEDGLTVDTSIDSSELENIPESMKHLLISDGHVIITVSQVTVGYQVGSSGSGVTMSVGVLSQIEMAIPASTYFNY